MTHLTQEQHETLNAAWQIIMDHTPEGSSWQLGPAWYRGCNKHMGDVTYYTAVARSGHHFIQGETFADRIENAIAIQAEEFANPRSAISDEAERLRKRLAELEGMQE